MYWQVASSFEYLPYSYTVHTTYGIVYMHKHCHVNSHTARHCLRPFTTQCGDLNLSSKDIVELTPSQPTMQITIRVFHKLIRICMGSLIIMVYFHASFSSPCKVNTTICKPVTM